MEGTIAQIMLFAGLFAPLNWLECNGATLPINQNQAFFSLFGATYGGDGITNFQIPNLPSPNGKPGVGPIYIICQDGYYPTRP